MDIHGLALNSQVCLKPINLGVFDATNIAQVGSLALKAFLYYPIEYTRRVINQKAKEPVRDDSTMHRSWRELCFPWVS